MTYFLRFQDQTTWQTKATEAGIYVNKPYVPEDQLDSGEQVDSWSWLYYTHEWAVDDIGTIYNDDAVYSDEGEVVTPPTPMDGWHVNFKGTLPDGWDTYVVTPNSPHRKFAGD